MTIAAFAAALAALAVVWATRNKKRK